MSKKQAKSSFFLEKIINPLFGKSKLSVKKKPIEIPVSLPPGSAGGGGLPKPGRVLAKDKPHID